MGIKRRAIGVVAAAVVNGVLGRNSAVLLTIEESIYDTVTQTYIDSVTRGVVIQFDQLGYTHSYSDDDNNIGTLQVKNGDVDEVSINCQDINIATNMPWDYDAMNTLWSAIYTINAN